MFWKCCDTCVWIGDLYGTFAFLFFGIIRQTKYKYNTKGS